jgi:hypothetical protein
VNKIFRVTSWIGVFMILVVAPAMFITGIWGGDARWGEAGFVILLDGMAVTWLSTEFIKATEYVEDDDD